MSGKSPFLRATIALAVAGWTLLWVNVSVAGPTPADRAAAETLFEQGLALMEQGNAEQACPKLEASQKLDPGVGTLLYLADCYETAGRTASAWATFLQASYAASNAGQEDRQQIAEENAERLRPTLSKLVLMVAGKETAGLTITNDNQQLNSATWGTEMPVDPGEHQLVAEAEGKKRWSKNIIVPSGPGVTTVEVPLLEDEPEPAVAAPPPEPPPPAQPAAIAPVQPPPSPTAPDRGSSSQATWGWVSIVGGGAALVGGGLFTFLAVSDNGRADDQCRQDDPSLCGERGVELGESAATKANIATVLAGVGGALAVTGAVLVLTAPDGSETASLRVGAGTSLAHEPRLVVEGTF